MVALIFSDTAAPPAVVNVVAAVIAVSLLMVLTKVTPLQIVLVEFPCAKKHAILYFQEVMISEILFLAANVVLFEI